jgi:membrane protease YdiL (CAAX protease family)
MYASFCLGVYFSALYLSSKNLLSLIIVHFIINFFSLLDEINFVENTSVFLENEENNMYSFIGKLITIIIYSIPLIIGLYIIFKLKKEDIKILNKKY